MNKKHLRWILFLSLVPFIGGIYYFVKIAPGQNRPAKEKINPCGIAFPKPTGYTNDFFHLFTEAEKFQLDSIIEDHEKKTGNQVAIITVDSTMLGTCNFEQYSLAIANEWGVGRKEKNNGIVLLIVPQSGKVRMENGYGIEKIISNEETKAILDNFMIPEFKKGAFFNGAHNGLMEIFRRLH